MGKIRLFKLPRHHPTLNCRQNSGFRLAEQTDPIDSIEKHARKPGWVQVLQKAIDMIFVLRQIQEKCREQNMGLYAAFVDLTKVGKSWRALTIPPNLSPSSVSSLRASKVRWSTMDHSWAASPSPTASSRGAYWQSHCSPSSSASSSVRQKRICCTASISVSEQIEVS